MRYQLYSTILYSCIIRHITYKRVLLAIINARCKVRITQMNLGCSLLYLLHTLVYPSVSYRGDIPPKRFGYNYVSINILYNVVGEI